MTLEQFSQSSEPPQGLSEPLLALWQAQRGHWEKAHAIVQNLSTSDAAWVHAWLHRKEGDDSNAGYWYLRAGRKAYKGALENEWNEIVKELLAGKE